MAEILKRSSAVVDRTMQFDGAVSLWYCPQVRMPTYSRNNIRSASASQYREMTKHLGTYYTHTIRSAIYIKSIIQYLITKHVGV